MADRETEPSDDAYLEWADAVSDFAGAPLGFDPASGVWRLETHMTELYDRTLAVLRSQGWRHG